MLRHYNVSQSELGGLHAKVAEAQKTLKDALYTADTVSKDQDKKIKGLEETVENLNKSVEELKKTTEKEQEKTAAQERKNELLQAKVTMLEENLATEQKTLEQRVADAEDKYTELAWYRMWVFNPSVDLEFLGEDKEKLLELWQTRLEEEERDNLSLTTPITKDDYIQDISSKGGSKGAPGDKSTLDAEIDVMLGDAEITEDLVLPSEEQVAVARQETIHIVQETLVEPTPEVQDPPTAF